jgi:hypothetical protein
MSVPGMNRSRQIAILIALSLVAAMVTALASRSLQSFVNVLAITFGLSLAGTALLPIRHDLITLAIGIGSAAMMIAKDPGPMSAFVVIIFFTVPYIGAAIGRDIRQRQQQR